jgi:glycosyltransferase involved in cell wall biosynthesis
VRVLHFLGIGRVPKRPMIDATGGTERVALEIGRVQARRGHEVTIASMAPMEWQGHWDGVRLLHLKSYAWAKVRYRGKSRDLREHLRLSVLIHRGRFDVVHLHEYVKTRFFVNQPKVMHFHNNPLDGLEANAFAEQAPRYWQELAKSSAQIAVSEFVARRLRLARQFAEHDVAAESIVVNQSGVNAIPMHNRTEQRTRIRQQLGLGEADVLFMFAGAVRPEKGVIQLAQAFARLSDECYEAHLAVAGGSKLWVEKSDVNYDTEQQVRVILDRAVERKRGFILGIISPAEITSYYAAADVFVLPSMFQETFGLVVLEAFAAGIPVIAARSGGLPELVQDGKNGLLVDQGDVEGLYLAMRQLLLDRERRQRLGEEAQRTARAFPWEHTVDRLERIYDDALARKSRPAR